MTNGDSENKPPKQEPAQDRDPTPDPDMTIGPASQPNPANSVDDQDRTIGPSPIGGIDRTIGPHTAPRDSAGDLNETVFGSSIGPESRPAASDRNIQIPGYEILDELGRGGMGVVYKARDVGLNRIVALKMILAGVHASDDSLARFKIEAEAVAQLQHRGIVQVYDVGQADGQPYCALEYIDGGGLDELMNREKLSIAESVAIVEELAHAMSSAHQAGIVHRDLKPANILIGKGGQSASTINDTSLGQYRPKITDFGLAKKVEQESQQTRTGTIMGTPGYMAPEQARGAKRIGPAADIYSLGAILFHLVVGRPPFIGETPLKTIMQVLNDQPTSPRSANPQVDRDLDTVILKCLEKEPAARYASAEHFAQDLHRYQMGMPIEARPVSGVERVSKWIRRKPWAAAMIALSALGLIGLLIGGAIFNRQLSAAYTKVDQEHEISKAALQEKSRALESESEARKAETAARAKTDAALKRAETSELESRQRLIDNYVNNGLQALEQKHALQSLPWLAEAIVLEKDPDRSRIHQWRFNMALQQAPKPEQTWIRDASVEGCMFSSDGKRILSYSADRMIEIRDIASNEVIHELLSPSQIIGVTATDDFSNVILVSVFVDAARGNFSTNNFNHQLWQPEANTLHQPFLTLSEGRPKFPPNVNSNRGWFVFRNEEDSKLQIIDLTDQSIVSSFDVSSVEERARIDLSGQFFAWIDDGRLQVADLEDDNKIVLSVEVDRDSSNQFCDFRMAGDGKVLLIDNRIRLLSYLDQSVVEFPKRNKGIPLSALAPKNGSLALAWDDGMLELFAADTSPIDKRLLSSKANRLFHSADGETLFVESSFDVLKLLTRTGAQSGSPIPSTLKPLNFSTLSDDGRYLATAAGSGIFNGNGCLRIWDVQDNSFKTSLLNSQQLKDLTPSPDGRMVALLKQDRTLQVVDIRNRRRQTVLKSIEGGVKAAFWSQSGKLLVVLFTDGKIQCFDSQGFKPLGQFELDSPTQVVGSLDGQFVAVKYGDDGKQVAIARVADGEILHEKLKHRRDVLRMQFSKDNQRLMTISEDINFRSFSVESGKREEKNNLRLIPLDAHFSPDGSSIAVGGARLGDKPGRLSFFDSVEGEPAGESLDFDAPVSELCFSRNGKLIAIADENGIVRLIDNTTKSDIGVQLVHPDPLTKLQFSHDGRLLLTVCEDQKIRLFDVASGVPLVAPSGNDIGSVSAIKSAQFLGKSFDILELTGSAQVWQNKFRNFDTEHAATLSRFLSGAVISKRGTIIPSPPESLKDDFSNVTIRQVMEPGFIQLIHGK